MKTPTIESFRGKVLGPAKQRFHKSIIDKTAPLSKLKKRKLIWRDVRFDFLLSSILVSLIVLVVFSVCEFIVFLKSRRSFR